MSNCRVACKRVVLPGGRLVDGECCVEVTDGTITSISEDLDSGGPDGPPLHKAHLVIPGFVDIHNHGIGGSNDILENWANPDYTLSRLPSWGITSCLASVVFSKPHHVSDKVISSLTHSFGDTRHGAVLEGIHAEGPVINDWGALPPISTDMSLSNFENLLSSLPNLKIMTISPHLESKRHYERLDALLRRNVVPALGHDKEASETEILGALRLAQSHGKRLHVTHCFNVSTFHHRNPGLVNFGLTSEFPSFEKYENLKPPTIELVGDLSHVHPLTLATAVRARRASDIAFVTDAVQEPLPGEKVMYNRRQLEVSSDATRVVLSGTDTLAGSCSSLLQTFYFLVNNLGVSIGSAVQMLAETPARIAGIAGIGELSVGKRGDMLCFDADLRLMSTIVAGRVAYACS